MLTNGFTVGLIYALMVPGWLSLAANVGESEIHSEETASAPDSVLTDPTASTAVETPIENPAPVAASDTSADSVIPASDVADGDSADGNSAVPSIADAADSEESARKKKADGTKADGKKRAPVSRSVARVNSASGNVEVLVQTEVNTAPPAGSSTMTGSSTVSGKLVIVGPDGTKREFELNDELPDDVRVFIGDENRTGGHFRFGTGQFRGKDPKAGQSQEKSVIVFSDGRVEPVEPLSEVAAEKRLMIGVHCVEADALLREHLKLDGRGLVVIDVVPDTPAAAAGFEKNDLLLQAGDSELKTVHDLLSAVQQAGENEISFHVVRRGDPVSLKVTPQKMESPQELVITLSGDEQPRHTGGMGVWWRDRGGISDQLREELELRRGQLKLRQIAPGIVIQKSSSLEEIERLVREAMNAAQQDAAAQPDESTTRPQTDADLQKQLREMKVQLESVLERVGKLENQD